MSLNKVSSGYQVGGYINFYTYLQGGNWNPVVQDGDNAIIWTADSDNSISCGFVIAPWSDGSGGIRITQGACYVNALYGMSDYRVKENVKDLDLNKYSIDTLRPVSFNRKESKKLDTGFIAHELQETEFSYMVEGEKDGENNQSVNYMSLVAVLVKEVQELKARVKELESKI